ncbi:hypothetical protein IG631_19385 [Alternaria alternata]|nr:hypothetical protein IG631_19385 [Alternaria alternata]
MGRVEDGKTRRKRQRTYSDRSEGRPRKERQQDFQDSLVATVAFWEHVSN